MGAENETKRIRAQLQANEMLVSACVCIIQWNVGTIYNHGWPKLRSIFFFRSFLYPFWSVHSLSLSVSLLFIPKVFKFSPDFLSFSQNERLLLLLICSFLSLFCSSLVWFGWNGFAFLTSQMGGSANEKSRSDADWARFTRSLIPWPMIVGKFNHNNSKATKWMRTKVSLQNGTV